MKSKKKIITAGIIGNALEWYEFSLYGYFAPVFAKLFFPSQDKSVAFLAAFSVFAVGFLTRPFGSMLFGYWGDKLGRKTTLAFSILLMSFATTAIGLLPTYAQAGTTGAILLIICRLMQGVAGGGEFTGSIVYLVEHAPANERGKYGGWVMLSTYMGGLLGSLMSALISTLVPEPALNAWGWRIPFLAGSLLGVIGWYLRTRLPETPLFLNTHANEGLLHNPLKQAFSHQTANMFKAIGLIFLPIMSGYLMFVYLPTYMATYLHTPSSHALFINTLSMVIAIIAFPIIGLLSDRFGRKLFLKIGALSFAVLSYPLFILLTQFSGTQTLISQMIFALLVACTFAGIPAMLVELFSTNVRYTALSLPYSIASAIFGGTTPLVATFLIANTNNILAPSFYLIFASIIMLAVIFNTKESFQKTLA